MRTATQDLDLFRVYLDQAGRHRLLTRQEEIELAKAIEAGDEAAKRRMIECNLRLVVSIARRCAGTGLPLSDMVQVHPEQVKILGRRPHGPLAPPAGCWSSQR